MASKFWYRRGGLERVMFDEVAWLEAAGHQVAHFSTNHPDNEPSPWQRYFAPYLELGAERRLSATESVTAAARMFSNRTAARRFGALIDEFKPDVVHAHGIHRQLSPSILLEAHRAGVPIVQSLHDYHHVCPADLLLRSGREVCDPRSCSVFDYSPAVRFRCVRGSYMASAVSAAETAFQRIRRVYERTVSRFVAPSVFLADVMRSGGWADVPLDVVPNATRLGDASEGGSDFLYMGRLSAEKGVTVAVDAARAAGVALMVAGEGPLGPRLRAAGGATYLGRLSRDEVDAALGRVRALVMPSLCPEVFGMVALEAMAAGVPVIASRLGGLPEVVTDGVDGILVAAGDTDALAGAMRRLADDPGLAAGMGAAGRRAVASRFTPEAHTAALLEVYHAARA